MAGRKSGGSRFFVLGAMFWLVVAAVLGLTQHFLPGFFGGGDHVAITVAVVVVTGLVLVFLLRPKS